MEELGFADVTANAAAGRVEGVAADSGAAARAGRGGSHRQHGVGGWTGWCPRPAGLRCQQARSEWADQSSYAKAGIRVNAVCPGPIDTRWVADHVAHVTKSLSITPMNRTSTADDIADTIMYLAIGTTMTTGQCLVVDGGRTV